MVHFQNLGKCVVNSLNGGVQIGDEPNITFHRNILKSIKFLEWLTVENMRNNLS